MKNTTKTLEKKILSQTDFEQVISESTEELLDLQLDNYLELLLNKYHKEKKEIIAATSIDLIYGYQIFNGTRKKPSRDFLLQIAFAFPLTVQETKHLLYYGHAKSLYPRIKRDAYIMFALQNQYSIYDTNAYLSENQMEPFF